MKQNKSKIVTILFLTTMMSIPFFSTAGIVKGTVGNGTYDSLPAYGLDFNNDGTIEFYIIGSGMASNYEYLHTNSYVLYNWTAGGNNIWGGSMDNYEHDLVHGLTAGTSIGSNGQWDGAGDCNIIHYFEDTSMVPLNQDAYVGFRIQLPTGVHYGWAKINVTANTDPDYAGGFIVTWLQIAYQTTPGQAILAGDTCETITHEFSETAAGSYTWNETTYTSSGDYQQTFTAANGCDSVVTLHLTITLGVANNNLSEGINIYPNPCNNSIHIFSENAENISSIELFDISGKLLLMRNNIDHQETIPMDNFTQGIYILKITQGNASKIRKIVKY